MTTTNEETTQILDLLRDRWSPRAFSPEPIPTADLKSMLEAARWSPSAANLQPWRFVVGLHGSQEFNTIVGSLSRGNASWATNAAALILLVAVTESEDGEVYRWAPYDLGQAAAHLSIQAHSLGYVVHQLGGFDVETLRRDFDLEERFEPYTVIVVGKPGRVEDLPERYQEREKAPRSRQPLADIVLCGLSADTAA